MKKLITSFFIISLFFVSCKKGVPLENPSLSVQAKSVSQVEAAVKKALTDRRWAITRQSPGVFEAKYSRREATANIRVSYSKNDVTISLVSSQGLDEATDASGNKVIHKTYASWIKSLENQIYIELSKS